MVFLFKSGVFSCKRWDDMRLGGFTDGPGNGHGNRQFSRSDLRQTDILVRSEKKSMFPLAWTWIFD